MTKLDVAREVENALEPPAHLIRSGSSEMDRLHTFCGRGISRQEYLSTLYGPPCPACHGAAPERKLVVR